MSEREVQFVGLHASTPEIRQRMAEGKLEVAASIEKLVTLHGEKTVMAAMFINNAARIENMLTDEIPDEYIAAIRRHHAFAVMHWIKAAGIDPVAVSKLAASINTNMNFHEAELTELTQRNQSGETKR